MCPGDVVKCLHASSCLNHWMIGHGDSYSETATLLKIWNRVNYCYTEMCVVGTKISRNNRNVPHYFPSPTNNNLQFIRINKSITKVFYMQATLSMLVVSKKQSRNFISASLNHTEKWNIFMESQGYLSGRG